MAQVHATLRLNTTAPLRKGHRVHDISTAVVPSSSDPSGSVPRRSLPAAAGMFLWDLPRNILIILLKTYRKVISPLYGQVCRFFPSCSAYALEAVTVHGAVKGSWLAAKRLAKCHPWNAGGVDHVPAGHRHWPEGRTPTIVVLNNPDQFLAVQADEEGRSAA
ncbi:membrane protein insertion efficiency factor YidD [Paenarthrobacter aurescens]|uniref:membrane protein insertion efficiency factor YidD n=1 Tax=Paenarthrobacter aurescens TaxID=43663 RepID=UPI001142D59E|nr:membrane protein insertion efficiency factor YidD [Paenarthrobacter aurescens]MDO6141696.1 membrane protein insertion efficiency factor YidD [Paenarthrobacter aurescens]MDO6149459.1 membrane protein insertion efficiency factor YidD [Paenarthrobacter aurescens]MDO6156745.1 membrane protein insertion efficiency factor YidD [Paenarthrobacter aurescens]MDO6160731.1 membrane protein insertion efficiency factor YidD [Paenarthrobacter aurescens]